MIPPDGVTQRNLSGLLTALTVNAAGTGGLPSGGQISAPAIICSHRHPACFHFCPGSVQPVELAQTFLARIALFNE